ncbi:MAG: NYN domain-containing protein [Verrucomicrobia bacterium]|nr:NYN domain-containing protein [Verrucomicrobiota bacterium]
MDCVSNDLGHPRRVAVVRILVDGYSLLHYWTELAPGRARHSAEARDELVRALTRYHDSTGTPITVVFDGNRPSIGSAEEQSTREVEILYSRAGQTADQIIERAAHRLSAYGDVLVVTQDLAERDTVRAVGGMTCGCENFIRMLETAGSEMRNQVQERNLQERNQFKRARLKPPGGGV